MTNLERNADVVRMATYAPLFAHIEGWQWRPDAIWFNNTSKFNTCSYYVQQLYATNKGTHVLPLTMKGKPVAGNADQDGLFASAVLDKNDHSVIVKIVNTGEQTQTVSLKLKGWEKSSISGSLTTFHADNMDAENMLESPQQIIPQTTKQVDNNITIPAKTFAIYRFSRK